jgi:hypothetical protein
VRLLQPLQRDPARPPANSSIRGVTVHGVSTWELFWLLHGRRSRSQVAALAWSDGPAQVPDAGLPYPFRWAADDLLD